MANLPDRTATAGGESSRPSLWWWLRVVEVRFRFVVLVCLALLVMTQWGRLRALWDDAWHAWRGTSAVAAVSADREYFCPMDPGVVSVWPAICPICNMDLVQRKKHDAQLLPEGVVARMQLSPYRIQLAGIRTSVVEARELAHEVVVSGVLTRGSPESVASGDPFGNALWIEAALSRGDRALFDEPREATVTPARDRTISTAGVAELVASPAEEGETVGAVPRLRVTLTGKEASQLAVGESVRAVVKVPVSGLNAQRAAAPIPSAGPASDEASPSLTRRVNGADTEATHEEVLAVPESAVVDHGHQQLVFVESMPGMFDAVVVTLGRRCGEYYPVLSGLKAGQPVAVTGAFLIDAETRLNPSLAVQYFGANQTSSVGRAPEVRVAKKKAPGVELSPEDVALARKQGVCPVTDLPLDSMGGPVPVVVAGRKVFLCCRGCEGKLTGDPAKYLAKLPADD
jgi:Cu(I)/Ag(I) efflux system membrane fusion protein